MLFAIIVSAIITGVVTGIYNVFVAPLKRDKARQDAIENDRVVKTKFIDIYGSHEVEKGSYLHIYEYHVNGKRYRRYVSSDLYDDASIGKEFEWYYRKHPSRAQDSDRIGRFEYEWVWIFLVTFLIMLGLDLMH